MRPDAPEATTGFLLNHLISELLPDKGHRLSNSDPVTGQAAWFDLRVRIEKAAPQAGSQPTFAPLPDPPRAGGGRGADQAQAKPLAGFFSRLPGTSGKDTA